MKRLLGLLLLLGALTAGCGNDQRATTGHSSANSVVDTLGCHEIRSAEPSAGLRQDICSFQGHRMSVWTFQKSGSYHFASPSWVAKEVAEPSWWVGCSHVADCVAVQRKIGGNLSHRADEHGLEVVL